MTTYTPEQTQTIVELYRNGATVEAIAGTIGKTTRSVVAKLSREGVYKAQTKESTPRVTKEALVRELETKIGLEAGSLDTFEKCSRDQLVLIVSRV